MIQSEEYHQNLRYYNLWATTVPVTMEEVEVGDKCLRKNLWIGSCKDGHVIAINQNGTFTVINNYFIEVVNVKASELRRPDYHLILLRNRFVPGHQNAYWRLCWKDNLKMFH